MTQKIMAVLLGVLILLQTLTVSLLQKVSNQLDGELGVSVNAIDLDTRRQNSRTKHAIPVTIEKEYY